MKNGRDVSVLMAVIYRTGIVVVHAIATYSTDFRQNKAIGLHYLMRKTTSNIQESSRYLCWKVEQIILAKIHRTLAR